MIAAFELGGFFAAHAIWCVSDGETLIPMLAYTTADGSRQMERFVGDFVKMVEMGQARLAKNDMNGTDGAFLYDGRITLSSEKLDAILVEMRAYSSPKSRATIAVPYTPKGERSARFLVHRPKLIEWTECDDFDSTAVLEAFFAGVDAHEQGAAVWNAALDQSK
jgi:hypothetical protein